MEPRALASTSTTPFKETKDNKISDLEKTGLALSRLSLTSGMGMFQRPLIQGSDSDMLKQKISLHLARRKSLQHAPIVSSPLARKVWNPVDT